MKLSIAIYGTGHTKKVHTTECAHLGLLLVHLAAGVAEVPREAKVGDLADFIVIHEDVAGGEVAVDYLE